MSGAVIDYYSDEAKELLGKSWEENQPCCVDGCENLATRLTLTNYHSVYLTCIKGLHRVYEKGEEKAMDNKILLSTKFPVEYHEMARNFMAALVGPKINPDGSLVAPPCIRVQKGEDFFEYVVQNFTFHYGGPGGPSQAVIFLEAVAVPVTEECLSRKEGPDTVVVKMLNRLAEVERREIGLMRKVLQENLLKVGKEKGFPMETWKSYVDEIFEEE